MRNALRDLPGQLIERPWVDFSTNRNQALAIARNYGDYALFIDADDVLVADTDFSLRELQGAGYVIETVVSGVSSWVETLACLDIDWTWKGVLHEILVAPHGVTWERLRGLRLHKIGDGARSALGAREKYAQDALILRQALQSEPGNTRYRFYLAHSLRESGQYGAAIEAYKQYFEQGTSPENRYFSLLTIAVLGAQIGWSDGDVLDAYRRAYEFRPARAETMSRLARHHLKHGRYTQAIYCAQAALSSPATNDGGLVDLGAWSWKPLDDIAAALLQMGDEAGAVAAYRQMLADPLLPQGERQRVQRNLSGLGRS
ncbi:MAG: family 2 glycosyl transferase [Gammaproteobacteria bacterium]|nr:MAG: family 2 glycosyl transferase [Gammaproteobacteria bacterium]